MKRPNLGVFGREAARPYVLGIVAAFSLAYDRFDWSLAESKWAFSAVEPYGVDACRNKMALATANSVQLINMDTGEARFCHTLGSIRDTRSSSRPMERNSWSARLVSMPFLNSIRRVEKSFGNGSRGTMVSTDQSWVTTLFVRPQDAERSPPWVTKCFWWTIRQSTNSAFLLGKNRPISTAPATTRMEGFLSLCFIKERAM